MNHRFTKKVLVLGIIFLFSLTNFNIAQAAEAENVPQATSETPVAEANPVERAENSEVNSDAAINENLDPQPAPDAEQSAEKKDEVTPPAPDENNETAEGEPEMPDSSYYYNYKFDKLKSLGAGNGTFQTDFFSGDAVYNYNLDLPAGRNGLEPTVSLNYSSRNRALDSLVGYGWSLGGAEIKRVNLKGSEKLYDRFDFSLNLFGRGGMLIPQNIVPESQGYGDYTVQVENEFLKVHLNYENNWIVQDKNGITYSFGIASNHASKLIYAEGITKTYLWKLDEIRDLNGNFIRFHYEKDSPTGFGGQIYPSKITYTGHGNTEGPISIHFNRVDRVDKTKDYAPVLFPLLNDKIIDRIDVKVNNVLRRQYFLSYQSHDKRKRSLLNKIEEKSIGADGAILTMPATTFNYSPLTNEGFQDIPWPESLPEDLAIVQTADDYGAIPIDFGVRIVDVNGDSRADIIRGFKKDDEPYIRYTYINKSYYDENGNFVANFVKDEINYPSHILTRHSSNRGKVYELTLLDQNGDSLVDFPYYINNGINNWYKDTTFWYHLPPKRSIRDFNGDGLPDLIEQADWIAPDKVESEMQINIGREADDYQGNYKPLLKNELWKNALPIPIIAQDGQSAGVDFMDVNGDGLTDLVEGNLFMEEETSECTYKNRTYINTGLKFETEPSNDWKLPVALIYNREYVGFKEQGVRFVDYNGDGLMDIIKGTAYVDTCPEHEDGVYINNGTNDWYRETLYNKPTFDGSVKGNVKFSQDLGTILADFDGDGMDDYISARKYYDYGGHFTLKHKIAINRNEYPDLLVSINNGNSGKIDIEYKPSTYYRNEDDGKISNVIPFVMQTVSKIKIHDNNGNINETTYKYKGGQYNFYGSFYREFAGFAEVIEKTADRISHYYYHTGDPKQQKPFDLKTPDYSLNNYHDGQIFQVYETGKYYVMDNGQKRNINKSLDSNGTFFINTCLHYFGSLYSQPTHDRVEGTDILDNLRQTTADQIPDGPKIPFGFDFTSPDDATEENCGNIHKNNASYKLYPPEFALKGKLYRQVTSDLNNKKLFETVNEWDVVDLNPNAPKFLEYYFAKLKRTVEITYNQAGNHKDKSAQFEYDTLGNITKETNLFEVQATINSKGQIASITDVNPNDNIIVETAYAEKFNTESYLKSFPKTKIAKKPLGEILSQERYYYDQNALGYVTRGNVSKKETWYLNDNGQDAWLKTEYKYDRDIYPQDAVRLFGLLKQIKDPLANVTNYYYEFEIGEKPQNYPSDSIRFNFYPIKTVYKSGLETWVHKDIMANEVDYYLDANKQTVKLKYDPAGRLTGLSLSNPLNNDLPVQTITIPYTNNVFPNIVHFQASSGNIDPDLKQWKYFDGFGQLIQEKTLAEDAKYYTKSYLYDSEGRLKHESFSSKSATSEYEKIDFNAISKIAYTYDVLDRLIKKDFGSTHGYLAYDYDILDHTETFYAMAWKQNRGYYPYIEYKKKLFADITGNLVKVHEYFHTDPRIALPETDQSFTIFETNYQYDDLGNLIKIIDSEGNKRNFQYDKLGRLMKMDMIHRPDEPDFAANYQYKYDEASNLIWSKDPNNNEIK